ncbi:uncharacterized protein LOC136027860 [Artemia franciscana]
MYSRLRVLLVFLFMCLATATPRDTPLYFTEGQRKRTDNDVTLRKFYCPASEKSIENQRCKNDGFLPPSEVFNEDIVEDFDSHIFQSRFGMDDGDILDNMLPQLINKEGLNEEELEFMKHVREEPENISPARYVKHKKTSSKTEHTENTWLKVPMNFQTGNQRILPQSNYERIGDNLDNIGDKILTMKKLSQQLHESGSNTEEANRETLDAMDSVSTMLNILSLKTTSQQRKFGSGNPALGQLRNVLPLLQRLQF